MMIQTEKTIAIAHLVQTADEDSPCRRLHGHNMRVVVTIHGEVKENGMVVDFRHIKEAINILDHKTIIPNALVVAGEDGLLHIKTGYSRLTLPITDVVALNVPTITSETLAIHLMNTIKMLVGIDDFVSVCIYESEKSFAEIDSDDII